MQAWYNWSASNAATSTCGAATNTWYAWQDQPSYATTSAMTDSTASAVWRLWHGTVSSNAPSQAIPVQGYTRARAATAEEIRQERERRARVEEEYERKQRDLRVKRARASDLAKELLLSLLDDEQREELRERKWFLVVSQSGKVYRIRQGHVGNVDLLDDTGRIIQTYCVHLPNSDVVPTEDHMLAQKLWLEADEDGIIRKANRRPPASAEVIDLSRFREVRQAA